MSVTLNMRDRIAAAAQVELRTRGLASGADVAFAIADRALEGTRFAALTSYIAAVETAAPENPARDIIAADPVLLTLLP